MKITLQYNTLTPFYQISSGSWLFSFKIIGTWSYLAHRPVFPPALSRTNAIKDALSAEGTANCTITYRLWQAPFSSHFWFWKTWYCIFGSSSEPTNGFQINFSFVQFLQTVSNKVCKPKQNKFTLWQYSYLSHQKVFQNSDNNKYIVIFF